VSRFVHSWTFWNGKPNYDTHKQESQPKSHSRKPKPKRNIRKLKGHGPAATAGEPGGWQIAILNPPANTLWECPKSPGGKIILLARTWF
jgi:hypothetical protein